MSVNEEQQRAARHGTGPAIVLAGPGTGKTRTLVARHLHLASLGIPREQVMAITFTAKAADELRSRISEAHGVISAKEAQRLPVGTFHSLCGRFLRRFPSTAGLRRGFHILDVPQQRQVIADLGLEWDSDDGDLIDIIGRWKDSMVDPAQAAGEAARSRNRALGTASTHYEAYERELRRRGACDFADLILLALKGIERDAAFRDWVRGTFRHVLVDEFQDVNKVQVRMLQAALGSERNIWAVGDDDQSLYGWRGADARFSVEFASHFEGAETYALSRNYRCAPVIVAAANAVIAMNRVRSRKSLVAVRGAEKGDGVVIRGFETDRDEATWVARQVATMLSHGGRPGDVAVLFRTAAAAASLQHAFESSRIPFTLNGAQNFWTLPEVRAVAATLNAISRPADRSTREALGSGKRGTALATLVASMRGSGIADCAAAVGRAVGSYPPLGMSSDRNGLWADAAEQAAQEALRFESIDAFLAHADAMAERRLDSAEDAVSLSTIHSSKGLEWKHVFITACESDMMPHHKSQDVEEERRLFFVALTRARTLACLTYARNRFARGRSPSPFLIEMADRTDRAEGEIFWPGRPAARVPAQTARRARRTETQRTQSNKEHSSISQGSPATYRKRGGKSLIPPEEAS